MPTTYARPAATDPTIKVDRPDRHQTVVDPRLFTEPMAKNTAAVAISENRNAVSTLIRNGSNGTNPQTTNALNVLAAAHQGERAACGNPYSSVNMV